MQRVKLLSQHFSGDECLPRRQLPHENNVWGDYQFTFDLHDDNYDYLVVYDDLPVDNIKLACPREHTIHIQTEPVQIKVSPPSFARQFGAIITTQESFADIYPNTFRSQAGFIWGYGSTKDTARASWGVESAAMTFEELDNMSPPEKKKEISTVCSHVGIEYMENKGSPHIENKYKKLAFHAHRLAFIKALKNDLPMLDFFGRDHNPAPSKVTAIADYKYCLTIENYLQNDWWTEKLADAFLGYALPIFHGCPNLSNYFPPDSFIPINIYNYSESLARIKQVIESNEYEKRLPAIIEARKRLMYEHNIFSLLNRVIKSLPLASGKSTGYVLENRTAYKDKALLNQIVPRYQYKMLNYKVRREVNKKIQRLSVNSDLLQKYFSNFRLS